MIYAHRSPWQLGLGTTMSAPLCLLSTEMNNHAHPSTWPGSGQNKPKHEGCKSHAQARTKDTDLDPHRWTLSVCLFFQLTIQASFLWAPAPTAKERSLLRFFSPVRIDGVPTHLGAVDLLICGQPGGGGLQLVLMQHPPPRYLSKLAGGGELGQGGGVGGRVGGVFAAWPGGGGCAQRTTITCIPQGGVWGHGGVEVCMR